MPKAERDEERAVTVLMSELRDGSEKLATSLFPKGPVGTTKLTRDQELDLVARHWNDPKFRQNLLDRMAPPGPNGYPDPELAQDFVKLYQEAVLDRGGTEQQIPDPALARGPQQPQAQPVQTPTGQGMSMTVGTDDPMMDGLSPASYRDGEGQTPTPTPPPAGAPPSADPTAAPAATGEAMIPDLPPGMTPPPVPPEGL